MFRRVDELFILVPMLGNLKGNLEMCLSARLGTSANIGELNHRPTRQALISANLTLLGLQSLLISALAAIISFILGLITIHRLGDTPPPVIDGALTGIDPGLAVGEQEFHEGYTRPGWKQLFMVLATGMGAAGLSSAVLGSFMSSLVVLCTWLGVDPGERPDSGHEVNHQTISLRPSLHVWAISLRSSSLLSSERCLSARWTRPFPSSP